jgi:hypothetical protein
MKPAMMRFWWRLAESKTLFRQNSMPKRRVSSSSDDDAVLVRSTISLRPASPQPLLPPDQMTRIERMRAQPLFLIAVSVEGSTYKFKVSGSTTNLYTVTVDPEAKRSRNLATCDCPDYAIGANFRKCHCKHSCFVLLKVCGMHLSLLVDGATLPNDLDVLKERMTAVDRNRNWGGLTDASLLDKYNQIVHADFTVPPGHVMEACAICFDEQPSEETSARCQKCRNCFHRDCIGQWMATSASSACPLCRGSWKAYDKTATQDEGGFVNLNKV